MTTSSNLQRVLDFLRVVAAARLRLHTEQEEEVELPAPDFFADDSPLARFIETYQPDFEEYVVLCLALAPHLKPDFFSGLLREYLPEGGDFPEFGGVRGGNHRGLLPTGETAQFLLGGTDDLEKRLEVQALFSPEHWFAQKGILFLESVREGEPGMSGRIVMDEEHVQLFTLGKVAAPRMSMDFPAEYITTELIWDDLVLPTSTLHQIREIETWMRHHPTLMNDWGMRRRLKPGYRALFHGPPGTGKTLTATLLGKNTGRLVFRIDLSLMISKFIGETEKNLSRLFDKARNKDWILFFDEADALFGKRTNIRDAHDKYANQEVAYLLQRIETHPGLVILASNFKSNIDEAFIRRFQSVVHFPIPAEAERLRLWQGAFPEMLQLDSSVSFPVIAKKFEMTGANILNVVQYVCLEALASGKHSVNAQLLTDGIQKEFQKENKFV
ncbi:MAG: ATP-binding protein [Saprospiraceae bacterium]